MRRGDIVVADLGEPGGVRPVVIVTRTQLLGLLSNVNVVPVTRRIRGHRYEVPVGKTNGLRDECVANCSTIEALDPSWMHEVIGRLNPEQLHRLDQALRIVLDLNTHTEL